MSRVTFCDYCAADLTAQPTVTVTHDSGLVPTLDFCGVGCMLAHYSKPHSADTSASETSSP